ncbi:RNA polymerase sigma factor [Nocardioides sp. SR21]|uniref:RNA polymerase sigma factor n=1 Tax=Nocardioides sp. SR21 TaxID=2919501 RepID=UPI001FAA8F5D|nr:RNA polymerase sigma factor [Nocardioides sp. SR21]
MTPQSRAALREALRSTSPDLLGYLERRVSVREDAADLLGEVMLQAWRRRASLPDERARQRMWLFTIAANVLANHRRSLRRRTSLTDRLRAEIATTRPDPDPADRHAVRDAVLRLHDAQRELVMLIHWDGFTIVEAAELLGLNPSTARGRYAAARETLKRALEDPVRQGAEA